MKTHNRFLFKILFFLVFIIQCCFSQQEFDPQFVVRNQIAQLIGAKYGQGYRFGYTMFDARISYSKDDNKQDPYGTLKGCILFSAYKPDLIDYTVPDIFIVGMVKDGQIIWDNFPGSTEDLEGGIGDSGLEYAQDINNDGEVDLVFIDPIWVNVSDRNPVTNLIHILSWNGNRGRFISGKMIGSADCELIDTDGDGIKEIRTRVTNIEDYKEFKTSSYPYVTYGWNGAQYGLWSNVRQIAENEFIPANQLQIQMKCVVTVVQDTFIYSYNLWNQPSSKQRLNRIYINNTDNISSEFAPNEWTATVSKTFGSTYYYADYDKVRIKPNSILTGFGTISVAPPTIVIYYVQGYTGGITCCPSDEEERENILTNSVSGFTLGTRDISIVIDSLSWCDTLSSFATRSHNLGWLTTQPIADKYLAFFATAKTAIQTNNISAARTALNTVLHDVDIDSSSTLSSEAYALLRYNTEFLLEHLPAPSSALDMLDTLRIRLQQSLTNQWLGSQRFQQELDRSIQKAKNNLASGDSIGCAEELEAFQQKIQSEYLSKPKHNDKRFITTDGYQYLYPYTQSIIDLVKRLPPRSDASVADQLRALKSQIRIDAGNGLLGTEMLIRNLEKTVEAAQKQLQKKDSTGTAMQLKLFRHTVRRIYELTKKHFNEKLYMKPAGYVSLYYRAGYILDKLPSTHGRPMLEMEPELEKELKQLEQ